MTLKGKNVLVVGGSSGIGYETVRVLKEKGATVWNASRRSSDLADHSISWDVKTDFPEGVLPEKLHGLVYCPGSINLKPFAGLKESDFSDDFALNVLGAVKAIKGSLKNLKAAESASIVMFSTVAVAQGMNYHASIAASKGAVEGLVKSLAAEFSKNAIRVNAVAPSLTDTPLASNLLSTEEKRKASIERHPLKQLGSPADLAALVAFLLSQDASWITGQVFHADGGLSSIRPL